MPSQSECNPDQNDAMPGSPQNRVIDKPQVVYNSECHPNQATTFPINHLVCRIHVPFRSKYSLRYQHRRPPILQNLNEFIFTYKWIQTPEPFLEPFQLNDKTEESKKRMITFAFEHGISIYPLLTQIPTMLNLRSHQPN